MMSYLFWMNCVAAESGYVFRVWIWLRTFLYLEYVFALGVIHIDTESKTDRRIALETAIKLLNCGGNLMFFSEGIWNVEPSIPVLPLYGGISEIAFRSKADIIPVSIEQYDNHFQINIGQNMSYEDLFVDSTLENATSALRDELAKLKWEIFERNPTERINFDDINKMQHNRIKSKLYEWIDKNGPLIIVKKF